MELTLEKLNKDFIYSQDMMHFCFELPYTDLFGGVCFQRLFCSLIGDLLGQKLNTPVQIEGDDIFVLKEHNQGGIIQNRGKASVSIVCEKNGAILGHIGINIEAGPNAPTFAFSTKLTDKQVQEFMQQVINMFYAIAQDIFKATTKVVV